MRTLSVMLCGALALTLVTAGQAIGSDTLTPGPTLAGAIKREPVLMFDVTGSTLTGPLHSRYTVYNDGLITGGSCGGFTGANAAGTAYAPPSDVSQLLADLVDAGGVKLLDQNLSVADIPLTTVTVLKGSTNARAHTFSYWIGVGEYAQLASVIADFQAKYPIACSGVTSQ